MVSIKRIIASILEMINPKIDTKKDAQFIVIQGRRELGHNYGKWVIIDDADKIKKYVEILIPYIENEQIASLKYTHKEGHDAFPGYQPTLMVYCDVSEKENLKSLLKRLGLQPRSFMTQEETIRGWRRGGRSAQESDRQRILQWLRVLPGSLNRYSRRDNEQNWVKFYKKLESREVDLPNEIQQMVMPIAIKIIGLYESSQDWEEIKPQIKRNISNLVEVFEVKYVTF